MFITITARFQGQLLNQLSIEDFGYKLSTLLCCLGVGIGLGTSILVKGTVMDKLPELGLRESYISHVRPSWCAFSKSNTRVELSEMHAVLVHLAIYSYKPL